MKLIDTLFENRHLQPGEQLRYVLSELPERIKSMGLNIWNSGDRIQSSGKRILLGIAHYSREDLELLDLLRELPLEEVQLDIFIVSACKSQSEIEIYIPGIQKVVNTPVVGIWQDGILVDKAIAGKAIQILTKEINKQK